MKKLIALVCVGFLLGTSMIAVAGPQQEKMRTCNKDAKEKGLEGEDHKKFMKSCLSKEGEAGEEEDKADKADKAANKAARHEKRKACKKEAKEKSLKGKERREFMKACHGKKTDSDSVEETDKKDGALVNDKDTPQQEKMKTCNTEANEKALKGFDRRKFMSECLKG